MSRHTPALRAVLNLILLALPLPDLAAAQARTENVILVSLDGARPEEIFGGVDLQILKAKAEDRPVDTLPAYKTYWADTPQARRMKLMPFFWGTLMAQGSIAGNQALGSVARVTNTHRFSYPGYAEILTGEAHDAVIDSNDPRQNPYETVLEFVRRKKGLAREQVAAFASWGVFSGIVEHTPGAIHSDAGLQRSRHADPRLQQLDALQAETRTPWGNTRFDVYTFRLAMAHLQAHRPRLLYIAFDETDDWAHDGNYDLVLDTYARTDRYLRELWEWVQADPQYRDKTTIILTTDHGRGRTPSDWRSHGRDVEGAQNIWIAMAGPDHPRRGEWRDVPPVHQNQIAATIARLFGLDFSELRPTAGRPLP